MGAKRPWYRPCGNFVKSERTVGKDDCEVCWHPEHDHPETGDGH